MCPLLSVTYRPDGEPTVTVALNVKRYVLLIDTGATRSCIREGDPLISNSSLDAQEFSGEVLRVPLLNQLRWK